VVEEFFFDGVAVEPGDGAQPPGDGRSGAAAGFQVAGEALDIGPAGGEQLQVMSLAPAEVLAQVQFVGLAVRPLYPVRNPANASRSAVVNNGVTGIRAADGDVVAVRHLRGAG
jgi:hypothetical protein